MTTYVRAVAKLSFSCIRSIILEGEPAGNMQEAHERKGRKDKFSGRCCAG